MNDAELRSIIEDVISRTLGPSNSAVPKPEPVVKVDGTAPLKDIGLVNIREQVLIDNPENPEELKRLRKHSPARIATGRAGTRYKTETMLRFRADHAVAQDAVFSDVSDDFLTRLSLQKFVTKCNDKNEFITRPDLGRFFADDQLAKIASSVEKDTQVLIYVSDGLSSTAVEENVPDVLPMLIDGLKSNGVKVAIPFFVKYGRVPAMDSIGEATKADVVCVLIGERPGLVTAGSMSAYLAYKPTVGMPESRRTVISNIHRGGTPPIEAGAHLVDVIMQALIEKASGLDLKL